jgi:hypothetical protein
MKLTSAVTRADCVLQLAAHAACPGPRSQNALRAARERAQSRMRKDLKNGSLAKLKNGMKLGAHERQGEFAEGWKRQRVVDAVADARRARVHLVKDVMVHPVSVRAFQLLINKLKRRVPAADSRPPSQRQTVKKDRVVDQSSFIHANRHGREDLEAKGRRSDSHQIGGIRKECKNLPARDGNHHLSLEQMFKHCSGSYVWDGFLFVLELPLSGLSLASISRRRCSRKGGRERLSPSVSSGSSAVKPGSSVAISKSMPFGSRK